MVSNRIAHIAWIDYAVVSAIYAGYRDSTKLLKMAEWAEYRIMFDDGRNDVITLAQHAMNGQIERIGAVGCKDHVVRSR